MGKISGKRQSKRQPARMRYKIEKKVRAHNKKARREAKKNPKTNKQNTVQVPNICPFKEDILKEVEAVKKLRSDELLKKREDAKLERQKKKEDSKKAQNAKGLEGLVANAEAKGKLHEKLTPDILKSGKFESKTEQSLKQYYKEFKKVIEASDVILEVADARDPIGTRCKQVEETIRELQGNKRLVLVLNKADLVPRDILEKWVKYFKKSVPAIAFKASTQNQSKKLGQRKMAKNDKCLLGSSCVGAELLMSLLANYCRNKGIKTSIRVGIVGLPNVGKSSIINSLKRSRACNVGATPGVTRNVQEVQLDSKIKLLDSPGIVFAAGSDSSASLRNAVKISSLNDPFTPGNAILQRVTKQQMMELYDIHEYKTPEEFYHSKAVRQGKFKRGGIADTIAAARGLLEDWNSGKIKYYTVPPEVNEADIHISSTIVNEIAKEFDLENVQTMEVEVLNKIEKEMGPVKNSILLETLGPVDSIDDESTEKMEADNDAGTELLGSNVTVEVSKKQKEKTDKSRTKKLNPEQELEGNLKLNQIKKKQFKKEKKERNRRDKVATQLSVGLENFNISKISEKEENYSFDEAFPENNEN